MYEELNEVFEGDLERSCSIEDISRLKFMEACLKETLRLYPSAYIIQRTLQDDADLGGYQVPEGTSVSILIYSIHRNEEHFPDPSVYKPERFIDETGRAGKHPFAYIPFSAGSRNCIGKLLMGRNDDDGK